MQPVVEGDSYRFTVKMGKPPAGGRRTAQRHQDAAQTFAA